MSDRSLTLDEILSDVKQDIAKLVAEGEGHFRNAVLKSNLVLTGELLQSVDSVFKQEAAQLTAEATFTFNNYWRYRDMKQLNYAGKYINIDAILSFVEKVGVNKFAWVPGYEGRSPTEVPVGVARHRIAWAIIMQRRQVPVVKNENRRRLYNKTKAAFMNVLRRRMMERLGKSSMELLKISLKD